MSLFVNIHSAQDRALHFTLTAHEMKIEPAFSLKEPWVFDRLFSGRVTS